MKDEIAKEVADGRQKNIITTNNESSRSQRFAAFSIAKEGINAYGK